MSPTTNSLSRARHQQLLHAKAATRCAIAKEVRLQEVQSKRHSLQQSKRAVKQEREQLRNEHIEWKRDEDQLRREEAQTQQRKATDLALKQRHNLEQKVREKQSQDQLYLQQREEEEHQWQQDQLRLKREERQRDEEANAEVRRRQKLAVDQMARERDEEAKLEKIFRNWSEDDLSFEAILTEVLSVWNDAPETARQLYAVWYQCAIQHAPERFQAEVPRRIVSLQQLRTWGKHQRKLCFESREALRG
jgi:hypothetical protein